MAIESVVVPVATPLEGADVVRMPALEPPATPTFAGS